MILSGNQIKREIEAGRILIEPFDFDEYMNPCSYDVTLGSTIAAYACTVDQDSCCEARRKGDYCDCYVEVTEWLPREDRQQDTPLDFKKPNSLTTAQIGERGFTLRPGIGYLAHINERICTEHYVPILDGKSSVARMFVGIHQTAGFGDPGFDGQFTLEMTCQFPVRIYAGMRIGQVRFQAIDGHVTSYKKTGHYQGETSKGPVASHAWESSFKKRTSK